VRQLVAEIVPDIVLLDQILPDGSGLEVMQQLLEQSPGLPIIMMTGAHDLELAIKAIQGGAYDFVYKPVQPNELSQTLSRALKQRRLERETDASSAAQKPAGAPSEMIGQSRVMLEISKEIALIAKYDTRILISGESGTGKEVVARAIHSHSDRPGRFLVVNCAATAPHQLKSELFGHEKGAFAGAVYRKLGKFELASDGTLFLDKISELAPPLQDRLLRVLQEGTFERIGSTKQLTTQARVIAATQRDLAAEVKAGRFREDLLYELSVISLQVPPLRERREDIPLLAEGLMTRLADTLHRPPLHITEAVMNLLLAYDWPGNVRELENVIIQALVHARNNVFTPDLLVPSIRGQTLVLPPAVPSDSFWNSSGRPLSLDELEAWHIQRVLNETNGHKGRTCHILGISRPALDRKIGKYGLQLNRNKAL
jgi:two-component system response regulator AtoC